MKYDFRDHDAGVGMTQAATVLDVLEEHFGARPTRTALERLTVSEVDALADQLREFWDLAPADDEILADSSFLGGWRSSVWSEPVFRTDLSDSLLYYTRLVVLDPLADFLADRSALPEMHGIRYRRPDGVDNVLMAGPRLWSKQGTYEELRVDPAAAAAHLATIVEHLYAVEELIREDVLVLRSQWAVLAQRGQAIAAGVRRDVDSGPMQSFVSGIPASQKGPTVWDNLQGGQVEMNLPVRPADVRWKSEPAFYYLNKTLAIADAWDAKYVPSTRVDLDLLTLKVNVGLRRVHPEQVLREVARLVAPSVDVPIRQAVAVRRSSEDFEAWRRQIRQIERAASADTPEELRERVEDELRPKIDAVRLATAKNSFAQSVRADGVDVVIGGAVAAGGAVVTQQSGLGVAVATATGVLPGALGWIRKAYTRDKPRGASAVLTTLLKDRAN